MSYQSNKFIFLATARTGSHTISELMVQHLSAISIGTHHSTDFDPNTEKRDIISFIRNPYDLIVSHYCAQKKAPSFETWLPTYLLSDGQGRDGRIWFPNGVFYPYYHLSDTIYRFEEMEDAWDDIWRNYGDGAKPKLVVRPPRRDYNEFYTDATRKIVSDWIVTRNATCGEY